MLLAALEQILTSRMFMFKFFRTLQHQSKASSPMRSPIRSSSPGVQNEDAPLALASFVKLKVFGSVKTILSNTLTEQSDLFETVDGTDASRKSKNNEIRMRSK